MTHRVFLLNPKKLLVVLLVFSLAFLLVQQKAIGQAKAADQNSVVVTYPTPPSAQPSTTYSVTVNNQPIFVAKNKHLSYVHFAFAGQADIKVTVSEDVQTYTLSPQSYNIASSKNGREITFSLTVPRKLIIRKVNDLAEDLVIFADPLEDNPPKLGDPSVVNILDYGVDNTGTKKETSAIQEAIDDIANQPGGGILYFPAGTYKTAGLVIPSHVTIYLAGGALVLGTGDANDYPTGYDVQFLFDSAENSGIIGRGTIDMDGGTLKAGQDHLWCRMCVIIKESRNVLIQGITIRNPACTFIFSASSEYVTVYNVKLLPDLSVVLFDGMDPDSSRHITIENVFNYAYDDNTAVKNAGWYVGQPGNTEDIVVKNSVYLGELASLKLGTETEADYKRNVTFENIDVISTDLAMDIINCDTAIVENIYYRNIRIEEIITSWYRQFLLEVVLIQRNWGPGSPPPTGQIRNIFFQNCSALAHSPKLNHPEYNPIAGYDQDVRVSNVLFDNFHIEGELITSAEQGHINIGNYVDNVTFTSSDTAVVNIKASVFYASEETGEAGVFIVSRSGDLTNPVTVNYTIRGTAQNGTDYQAIPGFVTIPAGESSTTLTIEPIHDGEFEGLETVFVTLESVPHTIDSYMLGPDYHAVVNITENSHIIFLPFVGKSSLP